MTTVDPAKERAGADVAESYRRVRALTEQLAEKLSPEDQCIQSAPEVSPTKWHRAHTSWFFECFVLGPHLVGYEQFHPWFGYLFNSYYETVGEHHPRPDRGLLSRPGVAEIARYRTHVDREMIRLLSEQPGTDVAELVELGLHHEQQHQELVLMDIKHVLSQNPLGPAYAELPTPSPTAAEPQEWVHHPGGLVEIGHDATAFAFDNERPRHQVWLHPFALASRPVTNGEWLAFIDDGGYQRPELWLSDGWATVQQHGWRAPSYWHQVDGTWQVFTLAGSRAVNPAEPVCHISYYEADAFAQWAGARLPTEFEWEAAATDRPVSGRLLDQQALHPRPAPETGGLQQMFGDVWEWTSSAYLPYPGYQAPTGAVGEYNGKFMVNQHVLRGGCCATPPGHIRTTYRNFFPPAARWPFGGLRLAHSG